MQCRQKSQQNSNDQDKENLPVIFCRTQCVGAQGHRLLKRLTEKLKRIISKPFTWKNFYKATKMSYYYYARARTPNIVYEVCCPAYNASYIGKTDWNLGSWIKKHCGLDKNSPLWIIICTSAPFPYIVFHAIMMWL